jgi:cytochrome P450
MTGLTAAQTSRPAQAAWRPQAPVPLKRPPGLFRALHSLYTNPITIWTEKHYREPIVAGRTMFGLAATVSAPAAVRRVLLDNSENYVKDRLQLRVLTPGLGMGLLTAQGAHWRAQRRSLAPLFAARQLGQFAPAMQAAAIACSERLNAKRAGVIDMHEEMSRLTLDVLERTLFTQGLADEPDAFQRAVNRYFDTVARLDPLDVLGAPDFLPRLGRMRGRATLEWFRNAVDKIITARRALIAQGAQAPHDILTLLLKAQDPETGQAMSEEDLRSNIVTFIGAGHETTANALTWTLYLLSQEPEWRARLETEADSLAGADPQTLAEQAPIARAVLEESMRLYPPAALLSREAVAEDELCGVKIAPGTQIITAPFLLHRHRLLWRDPETFDPTRFLGANRDQIDRFAYLPFGAGPRVCIGMGFAMQEMLIILTQLVARYRFALAPGAKIFPQQRITLRPAHGLPMNISLR